MKSIEHKDSNLLDENDLPLTEAVELTNPNDEGRLVGTTTFALCVCMLAHSYLLISVFPYSGFMALYLLDVNEDKAAQYAGLIASAFMVGRAVTSILWGQAADRYGRSQALYASLILSCICSVLFGITKSFWGAMVLRFLLGCANGIMSTIKTVVSEICTTEAEEARTMSLVMGMWGWGFLVSPVLSGFLAEPVKQYPDLEWLDEGTVAGRLLRAYPFLLPNILGAVFCLVGMLLLWLFFNENLPSSQAHSLLTDLKFTMSGCSRFFPDHAYQRISSRNHSQGSATKSGSHGTEEVRRSLEERVFSSTMISILSQKDTRDCLLLYWGYSFVSLMVDEAFPLFCFSHMAGFGIAEKEIGKIMSFSGLIFALSQYGVYNLVYSYCGGLAGSIKIGAALSVPMMFLMPFSLLLNRGAETLNWSTFYFLTVIQAFHRNFGLVFFSSLSVALNRTVSKSNRGAMNGISVLGGSVAKAIGPAFAGLLVTMSASWAGRYASVIIFGVIGCFGMILACSTFMFLPQLGAPHSEINDDETTALTEKSIELRQNSSMKERK